MRYIKFETGTGECRWINPAQIIRATHAKEAGSGHDVLVIMFAGSDAQLKLHGSHATEKKAIETITRQLDALAES